MGETSAARESTSVAVLEAARQAAADLVNADPRGVVLGADRAVLLASLADASSTRAGLGYEMIVTRLDDEGRVRELSRMLAGLEDSEFGRAHAGELLAAAAAERSTPQ